LVPKYLTGRRECQLFTIGNVNKGPDYRAMVAAIARVA